MPVTRSIAGQGLKRAASPKLAAAPKRAKLPKPTPTPATTAQTDLPTAVIPSAATKALPTSSTEELAISVPLTIDVEVAKRHLLECDPRWASMFEQLKCRPFEGEDIGAPFNPFRSLATSILGQQVSWLAAKAITYRFCRLFFPDLPEKLHPGAPTPPFPSPAQLATSSVAHLRTAGLSGRKAEYILDLAARFADGRLSAGSLAAMNDEEVMEHLVAVRGIGRWTVEMFLIFAMRHPDVLPCGDLGIQKGLLKWYTNPTPSIIPAKIPRTVDPLTTTPSSATVDGTIAPPPPGPPASSLRTPEPETPSSSQRTQADFFESSQQFAPTEASQMPSVPPSTPRGKDAGSRLTFPPTPATPSSSSGRGELPPLPKGCSLSHSTIKARLKKPIKNGLYLTPKEMEELTEPWKPYRTMAIWYLWSLGDGADSSF